MRIFKRRDNQRDAMQRRRSRARSPKRLDERTDVDWLASASLGGIHLGGRLRDVSGGGAFFEPRTDLSVPDLLEKIAKRPLLERDDEVILSYEKYFDSPVQIVAKVRWLGPSREHDCYGLGVQFASE